MGVVEINECQGRFGGDREFGLSMLGTRRLLGTQWRHGVEGRVSGSGVQDRVEGCAYTFRNYQGTQDISNMSLTNSPMDLRDVEVSETELTLFQSLTAEAMGVINGY